MVFRSIIQSFFSLIFFSYFLLQIWAVVQRNHNFVVIQSTNTDHLFLVLSCVTGSFVLFKIVQYAFVCLFAYVQWNIQKLNNFNCNAMKSRETNSLWWKQKNISNGHLGWCRNNYTFMLRFIRGDEHFKDDKINHWNTISDSDSVLMYATLVDTERK